MRDIKYNTMQIIDLTVEGGCEKDHKPRKIADASASDAVGGMRFRCEIVMLRRMRPGLCSVVELPRQRQHEGECVLIAPESRVVDEGVGETPGQLSDDLDVIDKRRSVQSLTFPVWAGRLQDRYGPDFGHPFGELREVALEFLD